VTTDSPTLRDIATCFEGMVPSVIATAAADGTPNVTHLSKVHLVDDEHVALTDQFFSKTNRNLAENPYASVVVVEPETYDAYRLSLRFERSERRGKLFDRLDRDIEAIAALCGMQGVFKLRAVGIYRVLEIERYAGAVGVAAVDEDAS
jgi:predicted pyridoxine 5'-phosphate oxidase superfamily flavin-nucleotide-binding protein